MVRGEPRKLDDLLCPEPVEFDPCIFPRKLIVCDIGVDLFGEDHETLAALDLVFLLSLIHIYLDPVAYVRFASVYREFKDANTFMDELKKFLQ